MDSELPKILTHAVHVSKKISDDMDQLIKDMAEFKADLDKATEALSASHAAVQAATPEDLEAAIAVKDEPEPSVDEPEDAPDVSKRSHHKKVEHGGVG